MSLLGASSSSSSSSSSQQQLAGDIDVGDIDHHASSTSQQQHLADNNVVARHALELSGASNTEEYCEREQQELQRIEQQKLEVEQGLHAAATRLTEEYGLNDLPLAMSNDPRTTNTRIAGMRRSAAAAAAAAAVRLVRVIRRH